MMIKKNIFVLKFYLERTAFQRHKRCVHLHVQQTISATRSKVIQVTYEVLRLDWGWGGGLTFL